MAQFLKSNFLFFFVFQILFCFTKADAQSEIELTKSVLSSSIGKQIELFIDSNSAFNPSTITNCASFKKSNASVPVFLSPRYDIWARFTLKNFTDVSNFYLAINYSIISNIWLYKVDSLNNLSLVNHTGNATNFSTRQNSNVNFVFPFALSYNQKQTYYIKIQSSHPLELPIVINNNEGEDLNEFIQNFIIGIYLGIILSILLYNTFLFFSTKDKNYLLYVLYLFFLCSAQVTLAGWSFKYLWPNTPSINLYAVIWTSALAGITGVGFGKLFLNSAGFTPKLNKVLNFLIYFYCAAIVASLFGKPYLGYLILNVNGLFVGIFLLTTSINIVRQGYKPAIFYLIAWSFFLFGLVIFSLRNLGIIPTNNFTHSILYYASSVEVILLSIALADRINTLKKEKEISQAEALEQAEENELLVREQNVVLESKVEQRTHEIREANIQLSAALDTLKDAQAQLVDAEKMASLGQLTAGIAHEINNPINFVKSNINPLRLDVKDLLDVLSEYGSLHTIADESTYKKKLNEIENFKNDIDVTFIEKEINSLIIGIEDGAERTAEIVRGLRTFSRIDEAELKTVDVHEGIVSTLVLLKNSMPYFIKVEKNFNADGFVECYPGKLNQVFMNILNNAIQAIKGKNSYSDNEYIIVTTRDSQKNNIEISIKDSGMGMSEDVIHRIYEPFFTTKDVGEGTGLGMAIVFKIIQKHYGKIDIISKPGEGSEFIITLPHNHPISDH